jgi:hypothetical protein
MAIGAAKALPINEPPEGAKAPSEGVNAGAEGAAGLAVADGGAADAGGCSAGAAAAGAMGGDFFLKKLNMNAVLRMTPFYETPKHLALAPSNRLRRAAGTR